MFKSLILYRINADVPASAEALAEALGTCVFAPCGKTQPRTAGWVPPRGEDHGALVESVGGQWMLKLMVEQRILPTEVVKRRVEAMAEKVEESTGRKPGKKQRAELKDMAILELLPQAFTRRASVQAWIDPVAKILAVDASSQAKADMVATALVQCVPSTNLHMLQTAMSADTVMANWLRTSDPEDFIVARAGELRADDESKALVRYQNHALDTDEVRHHLDAGKRVTKLALVFQDRVSFVLTEGGAIRSLNFLGDVMAVSRSEGEDEFDANVTILTGELQKLIPALVEALGGEVVLPLEAAAGEDGQPLAPHTGDADTDPAYTQACAIVRAEQKASISLIQRHLRIGYNRAARLLERMESDGLVSAMYSGSAREVLAADDVGAAA